MKPHVRLESSQCQQSLSLGEREAIKTTLGAKGATNQSTLIFHFTLNHSSLCVEAEQAGMFVHSGSVLGTGSQLRVGG